MATLTLIIGVTIIFIQLGWQVGVAVVGILLSTGLMLLSLFNHTIIKILKDSE